VTVERERRGRERERRRREVDDFRHTNPEMLPAPLVPFERGLMTSYRHSIVTFPLTLPVSEILPFLPRDALCA